MSRRTSSAKTASDDTKWPRLLNEEASGDDIARHEAAKRIGDASTVLDLLRPSSTAHMHRVCALFGLAGEQPAGRWKKPSLWSRLFGQ